MGVSYGLVIAGYTVISFCGIAWRISLALNKILLDGTTAEGSLELLGLLRVLGEAFRHCCMHRCKEALQVFCKLPHY